MSTVGLECGPDDAWDARVAAQFGSVFFEEGRFRGWGICLPGIESLDEPADVILANYCESDDGIHWRKPDLKIAGQKRWPGNNLLKIPSIASVVRPLPEAGCKYLACSIQIAPPYPGVNDDGSIEYNGPGTYMFGSDDGLHWEQITRNPIVQHGDVETLHVDRLRGRYLLYQKVGSNHGLTSRRSMIVLESRDAIHWEGYHGYRQWHEAFFTDDYDDLLAMQRGFRIAEFYGQTLHQVGSLYIAIQNVFTVGLPLKNKAAQNPAGRSHLRLAFSHNGMNWRYPCGRPTFVESSEPGAPGGGFLSAASNIVEHGDDMWLYVYASRTDHGWGITPDFQLDSTIPFKEQNNLTSVIAAKFKRDRFASLASTYRCSFDAEAGPRQGDQLTINALTRNAGSVRVAIAEQVSPLHLSPRKSESLPGFSFDDCIPFSGDSVSAPVRFRNASITDIPRDKHLILRFEIKGGEVFGYEWVE